MTDVPEHLYTRQDDIDRIESIIAQLHDEARVELTLDDGRTLAGTITVRPAMQLFRDADGQAGFNAVVRIDDRDDPVTTHYLWIDRITAVTSQGSD